MSSEQKKMSNYPSGKSTGENIKKNRMNAAPQAEYENHLDEKEARWFAVYTKYKREKLVRQRLEEKGIHCYLPLQRLTRRYVRKVKQVELPLISCYVFIRIVKKEYVPVLETPDVVSFVRISRNLISIPEGEIRIMQRVVGEGLAVEVTPAGYQVGDEVEIIGGNLTGIQGLLLANDNKNNFLIELTNMGYSLRMFVNPALLRKLHGGR